MDFMPAELPTDEGLRQVAVDELHLNHELVDESLNRVTRLLAAFTGAPITAFTVLDGDRQILVSRQGIEDRETPRDFAFCGHTILQDDVFEIADATDDPRFAQNPLVLGHPDIRFYAGIPVRAPNGRKIGALCAIDTRPRRLDPAGHAVLRDLREVLENELLLRTQSVRDHLTGLYNRRFFEETVEREWRRALRESIPVSLLLMDVDLFKAYNDRYGHLAGDEVLRKIGHTLNYKLRRGGDFVGRYGGEEFVAILPQTDREGAVGAANALRRALHELGIEHAGSEHGCVTMSIGISTACSAASLNEGLATHLKAADEALYRAKQLGRDRVSVA
jgi:diguanylate cyclase (GGDEF)-like protein